MKKVELSKNVARHGKGPGSRNTSGALSVAYGGTAAGANATAMQTVGAFCSRFSVVRVSGQALERFIFEKDTMRGGGTAPPGQK